MEKKKLFDEQNVTVKVYFAVLYLCKTNGELPTGKEVANFLGYKSQSGVTRAIQALKGQEFLRPTSEKGLMPSFDFDLRLCEDLLYEDIQV
jgi:hypothetical protein